jgi:hypothetical protein
LAAAAAEGSAGADLLDLDAFFWDGGAAAAKLRNAFEAGAARESRASAGALPVMAVDDRARPGGRLGTRIGAELKGLDFWEPACRSDSLADDILDNAQREDLGFRIEPAATRTILMVEPKSRSCDCDLVDCG